MKVDNVASQMTLQNNNVREARKDLGKDGRG